MADFYALCVLWTRVLLKVCRQVGMFVIVRVVNVSVVLCLDACGEPFIGSSFHSAFSAFMFHDVVAYTGAVNIQIQVHHVPCVSIACHLCKTFVGYFASR